MTNPYPDGLRVSERLAPLSPHGVSAKGKGEPTHPVYREREEEAVQSAGLAPTPFVLDPPCFQGACGGGPSNGLIVVSVPSSMWLDSHQVLRRAWASIKACGRNGLVLRAGPLSFSGFRR